MPAARRQLLGARNREQNRIRAQNISHEAAIRAISRGKKNIQGKEEERSGGGES